MAFSQIRRGTLAGLKAIQFVRLLVFITILSTVFRGFGAHTVNLAWNASTDKTVAGYKVYYGTNPSTLSTSSSVDAGANLSATITNLGGGTFYFGAASYNSNHVESDLSNLISTNFVDAPVITSMTTNVSCSYGVTASLAVTATGSSLSYQWLANDGPITDGGNVSGTTTSTMTVTGAVDGNQGSYYVVVSNPTGSTTSSMMTLTVLDPPVIALQPANATRGVGATAVFTTSANGAPTLGYQWLKNGAPLSDDANILGSTTVSLTVGSVTISDAASYQCVVTNGFGSATSLNATLAVIVPATVSSQPASQTINGGSPAVFSVGASGTAPFSFSWNKNGSPLANGGHISGANTANLTVSSTSASDAGSYTAVVSNAAGSDTSSTAVLFVIAPPAITSQPANVTATTGSNATFSITAQSSVEASYQWLKNGATMADAGNIVGSTSAMLTVGTVSTGDAASYQCVVTNSSGSVTSAVAILTIVVPPDFSSQPSSRTANLGAAAVFSATATGTAPLVYAWSRNGSTLANGGRVSGANTGSLTITNIAGTDAGSYSATVTNLGGSVTSSAAILTVITPPSFTSQPSSVTANAGTQVSLSLTAQGSQPLSYQWTRLGAAVTNSATISGATSAALTFLSLSASDGGSYKCVVTNSAGSATSGLATVVVILPPSITTQPANQTLTIGATGTFAVAVSGTAPFSYTWSKNGSPLANGGNVSGATVATLTLASIADSDAGSYSCTITNSAGSATSIAALLTVSHATAILSQPSSQTLNACDSLVLSVSVGGAASPAYQWMHNGNAISDGTNSTYFLNTVSGTDAGTYYVQITGDSTVNSSNAVVVVNDPTILVEPGDNCVSVNATNVFVVQACGVSLNYQWYFIASGSASAAMLNGQTNSTLIVGPVNSQHVGQYYCVVSNNFNSVATRLASLGVEVPPTITSQPANKTAATGASVTFSVVGKASAPLTFQWVKNNTNVLGATNSNYTIARVQTNDAGTYRCYVGTTLCQSTVETSSSFGRLAVTKAKPNSKFTSPVGNTQFTSTSAELVGKTDPAQQIVVSGIASDTGRVADVTLSRTFPLSAAMTIHPTLVGSPTLYYWTNTVTLVPGTNIFAAIVTDAAGLTATNSVAVFFRVQSLLHIANIGAGTNLALAPTTFGKPTNNALLDIGRNYRVQAKPVAGNMFSNWVDGTGLVISRLATLEFRMQTNLQLVASFATNPIMAHAASGSYNGLFYETNEVNVKSAGAIFNFNVRTDATFSGTMKLDGHTYILTGSFDINGDAIKYITRSGKTMLTVQLHLDFVTKQITGTVESPDPDAWISTLMADLAPFSAANKFQHTARYTLAVPPDVGAPLFSPGGFGYGFITNNSLGAISFIGTLADGTSVSQTVPISQQNYWPLYIPLYANRGLIEGWINFSSGSPRGNISWVRPDGKLTTTYTNGFTNEVAIFGSPYTPRVPSLTPADGALNVGYPAMTYQYAVSNNNAIAVLPGSPNNNLSGSISAPTGAVSVSYRPTGSTANQTAHGAVLQWNNGAYGFIISGGVSAPLHLH